jgi:hypothetical protein
MTSANIETKHEHSGELTHRKDNWWVEPALVATGFTIFIAYATWRAMFDVQFYEIPSEHILSPFYSPNFKAWLPSWISPAAVILWMPAGFRATCYYYRKAYYRAYLMDPPACSVGHWGGKSYCGETSFPFILQNLHRYFFYLAVAVIAVLWWDAIDALLPDWQFKGFNLVNGIMLLNVVLLSGYTFGCHAWRHLVGGKLDCFSCPSAQPRYKAWKFVSKLNEHHMAWAWLSLFSVGFTDFIIREVASGAIQNIRFF